MAEKRGQAPKAKTSLRIDPAIYRRAWNYKLDSKAKGKDLDLGQIVSEALDEYLRKRGA